MKKLFTTAAIVYLFYGCSNNNKQPATAPATIQKDTSTVSFFPVTAFLKGQETELDSMQITFLHIVTMNGKTDSVWEKKERTRTFLKPFFAEEITETNLIALFKSTKFNDQTLNAVTFTYDPVKPLPDSLSLRHWDLYIDPETGKVIKLYIVREIDKGGITLQLTWQTGKWAKIVTLTNDPGGNTKLVREDKLIWKFE
jgi:hypothetical protein